MVRRDARHCWHLLAFVAAACGCTTPAQPYNQRGVALFTSGQYEAAREEFQLAVNEDPLDADAFYNLGSTQHRLGQAEEADWNYSRCLSLKPNHSKCRHARTVLLLERDRVDEAYASVQRWVAESPGNPDPLVELAWLERQAGRPEQARRLLHDAIAIQPRHSRALTELASMHEDADQPDRALVLYERALARDPNQPELSAKVADLRADTAYQSRSSFHSNAPQGAAEPTRSARDVRYEFR